MEIRLKVLIFFCFNLISSSSNLVSNFSNLWELCQIWDWQRNINNNISFHLRLFSRKTSQSVLQKPCHGNLSKFQGSGESRSGGSEKDRYFLKIWKWQDDLVQDNKRRKLVSFFLNKACKTCFYGLKISENIEIEHVF